MSIRSKPHYMTVQGKMQHWQSSPHQQACLIGILGPLEEEVELVDGGMLVAVVEVVEAGSTR